METRPKPLDGRICQVIGPIIDVRFCHMNELPRTTMQHLPAINDVLWTMCEGKKLFIEVQRHLGDATVRCVALGNTDGLRRGQIVFQSGGSLEVPVGPELRGRTINSLGEPIDDLGDLHTNEVRPIHHSAPPFSEQSPALDVLETGIKAIDLLTPFPSGAFEK